jgi:hypothetical protein
MRAATPPGASGPDLLLLRLPRDPSLEMETA